MKKSLLLACLLLTGCGPVPQGLCDRPEYAGKAKAMEECVRNKTCLLTGEEASYVWERKRTIPECWGEVEQ